MSKTYKFWPDESLWLQVPVSLLNIEALVNGRYDALVFTLSREQFAVFQDHAQDRWCQAAAQELFAEYEAHYSAFGASAEALGPMVRTTAAWAERQDIRSRADVTRLCHVTASLGHRFWQDPRFRGYVTASTAPEIPVGRRATTMMGKTKGWLQGLWSGASLQAFSDRLAELVAGGYGPEPHNLHDVLPGHWQMFKGADNDRFLDWLAQSAPEPVRDAGPRQLAYSACALAHGPQWLSDPQYPRLAEAVRSEFDPAHLAAQIIDIYSKATA